MQHTHAHTHTLTRFVRFLLIFVPFYFLVGVFNSSNMAQCCCVVIHFVPYFQYFILRFWFWMEYSRRVRRRAAGRRLLAAGGVDLSAWDRYTHTYMHTYLPHWFVGVVCNTQKHSRNISFYAVICFEKNLNEIKTKTHIKQTTATATTVTIATAAATNRRRKKEKKNP